jgi:hypothetical protein
MLFLSILMRLKFGAEGYTASTSITWLAKGKLKVRWNSVRHGLWAKECVIQTGEHQESKS